MLIKCLDCWHEDYSEYWTRNYHYERVCPNCGSTELDIPRALKYSLPDDDEPTNDLNEILRDIALTGRM